MFIRKEDFERLPAYIERFNSYAEKLMVPPFVKGQIDFEGVRLSYVGGDKFSMEAQYNVKEEHVEDYLRRNREYLSVEVFATTFAGFPRTYGRGGGFSYIAHALQYMEEEILKDCGNYWLEVPEEEKE